MDKKFKQNLLLVIVGVMVFAVLMNVGALINIFSKLFELILPILSGFVIAFVLNVPMNGYQIIITRLFKKKKKKPKKLITLLSLILTYITIITIIVVIITLIIPTTTKSIISLYNTILQELPVLTEKLSKHNIDISAITEYISKLDLNNVINNILSGAGTVFTSVAGLLSGAVSAVVNVGISIVVSIYVLTSKEELSRQGGKVIRAYVKKPVGDLILKSVKMFNHNFTKFLSGQCIEAVILGSLISLSFLIFKIPYSGLIGLLSGILSFIPYIGPFISCTVGAFFVLLADPSKFILCIVVFLAVQYVEEQFIYPHVVGGSVGLSPIWTLLAVLLGGKLFGVFGIFFSIPVTAVIFQIVKEKTNNKLKLPLSAEESRDIDNQTVEKGTTNNS